jgi:hypothetical protein
LPDAPAVSVFDMTIHSQAWQRVYRSSCNDGRIFDGATKTRAVGRLGTFLYGSIQARQTAATIHLLNPPVAACCPPAVSRTDRRSIKLSSESGFRSVSREKMFSGPDHGFPARLVAENHLQSTP